MCVCVCAQICEGTWRPGVRVGVFLEHFLSFYGQGISLNPELTDWLGWLASELLESVCPPLPPTPNQCTTVLGFFLHMFWGSEPRPPQS